MEAEGPPPASPSNRRSIAGRIAEPGPGAGGPRPAELPRTGGPAEAPPAGPQPLPVLFLIGGALGVLVVGGAIGYGLGRRGTLGGMR